MRYTTGKHDMDNELETLRPEVREALKKLGYFLTGTHNHNDFYTIRAELLRLSRNDADARIALDCEHDWQAMRERAEKAEAELAALKARIAEPVDRSHEYAQSKEHGGCSECGYPEWEPWHRIAPTKVED